MGEGWYYDFKHTHFDAYSPPDFYARVRLYKESLAHLIALIYGYFGIHIIFYRFFFSKYLLYAFSHCRGLVTIIFSEVPSNLDAEMVFCCLGLMQSKYADRYCWCPC